MQMIQTLSKHLDKSDVFLIWFIKIIILMGLSFCNLNHKNMQQIDKSSHVYKPTKISIAVLRFILLKI
jgi:hypothetical protein